jgi:hypothetical protein
MLRHTAYSYLLNNVNTSATDQGFLIYVAYHIGLYTNC